MVTWTLAKKDLRLLLRDRRAVVILLAMPFLFILVLGISLGEGFGQKPDDRLRVTIVDLDRGHSLQPLPFRQGMAWLGAVPNIGPGSIPVQPAAGLTFQQASQALEGPATEGLRQALAWLTLAPALGLPAGGGQVAAALALARVDRHARFPYEKWAEVVQRDLEQTAGIRVEILPSREAAQALVDNRERAAVLIFGPSFSDRVARCSFMADGINPFDRDGINLAVLDAELLRNDKQRTAASIIAQVAQVSLLRVVLPWMIGRAFEKIGDPQFIQLLGESISAVRLLPPEYVGNKVQGALQRLYANYNLTGKTWTDLTRSAPSTGTGAGSTTYLGGGLLNRGDLRYQLLVPSYTVMFAFFLVLTVGWLFVAERRQGTLKRLRAAPLSRTQILFGKLIPCFLLSLGQGVFLLGAGRLVFGMSWGPADWPLARQVLYLAPVVLTTSLAAMGLALLVASLARTETQVAIYGTLLVLLLAGISGCLMGDPELMPEQMRQLSRVTPHAWALSAYKELLDPGGTPNLALVGQSCGILAGFGVGFVGMAWWFLKLD